MKNDMKTTNLGTLVPSLLPSLPILLLSSLPHFYLFLYSLFLPETQRRLLMASHPLFFIVRSLFFQLFPPLLSPFSQLLEHAKKKTTRLPPLPP